LGALRQRTSVTTDITSGDVGDWDFAMMSIRWVEEANRTTLTSQFSPTGGSLVTGNEVAASLTNISTWRGTVGNDGRYWSTTRVAAGLDKQLFFDGVAQNNANKMIITLESANVTTANAFTYQICDWVSTTLVDTAAGGNCTGGGWRTLTMRKVNLTSTADTTSTYEIYNGYFWDRTTTPGTVVATPISNFITTDASKRVLIRVYSTVNSAVQHNMDEARIEMAIDPVYEASSFTEISPFTGATTAFVSDMIGNTASDANKFTITNNATNPMNVYFSFTGVRTYTGANTIVVKPEICVSTTALTFNTWIWNFTSSAWEQLNTALVTGTACATDTPYAYAKNNVTLTDYVSSGEVRIRFNTAVANTNTFQLDRLYIMVGSTNDDSALCEISAGTGTATNCTNTRTVADVETGSTANTNTWQITSVLEYPDTRWALDDDDAIDAEAIKAANLSFPITVSSGMAVTGIHWAARTRSNVTTETVAFNARDYGGVNTTGGWSGTIGTTNALTTYTWTDSWQSAELQVNPEDYIDTVDNLGALRQRTSVTTDITSGDVGDWDFAMMSIRWVETQVATPSQTLSFSISDNSIGFGTLASGAAQYATGDTVGSASETVAHTIAASTNATNGYVITVQGVTLTAGSFTINAIGGTSAASNPGTEQFGLRISASGGNGSVTSPYNHASNYAYAADEATSDEIASDADGDDVTTTYSIRYLGNISAATDAGSYSAVLTYTITASF